jgi:hypothetical protein
MSPPDTLSRRPDHGNGSGDNNNITLLKPELFTIRALEGITVEGEEWDILQEVRQRNHTGEQEDLVAAAAKALKESRGNSVRSSEWKESEGLLLFHDHIYVPNNAELRWRIVEQHHDTRIAGHAGCWKTLELVL